MVLNCIVVRGAGAQSVTAKPTGYGFDPRDTQEDEIFTYIYISISMLWCRGKARR